MRGVGCLQILAAAMAALPCLAAEPEGEEGWIVFDPKGGRFRIELPGKPQRVTESHLTPLGSVRESKWWWEADGLELAVETHDVPRLGAAITPERVILDRSREGVVASKGGTEIESREIEVQGAPAREFRYSIEGGEDAAPRYGLARTVLVGRRIYLLTGTSVGAPEQHPVVRRFFGSFRFRD